MVYRVSPSAPKARYDCFGAAHSSTSISAGLGMAVARDLAGEQHNVICVIGDGAISAGMAYEAMNNAGAMNRAPDRDPERQRDVDRAARWRHVGLSARACCRGPTYMSLRDIGKQVANRLPKFFKEKAYLAEELARGFVTGGTLFEELGFYYVGIVDGHDLDQLLPVLENVRNADNGPFLVHVRDAEGQRLRAGGSLEGQISRRRQIRRRHRQAAERRFERAVLHEGVRRKSGEGSAKDDKIVAITAAMPGGTGVDIFAKAFPDRAFDVGIAEQHGVTFAAGLATRGLQAVRCDLLDVPAARLRSGRARRGDPAAAGAFRDGPRRAWSAPTARPMPDLSTSPISAVCRVS